MKIINTYPSFVEYKNNIIYTKGDNKNELNKLLRQTIEAMYVNTSHITLKLRRCLAFLLFGHYTSIQTLKSDGTFEGKIIEIANLKATIDNCIANVDDYTTKAQIGNGQVSIRKYAKEKPIQWTLNQLMPASFMHTDLLLQNEEGGEVSFNSLSSGEADDTCNECNPLSDWQY